MFSAHFIAFAALHADIVIIQIIELNLNNLNLRILRKNRIQHLCPVMKGYAEMPNLSLFFQFNCGFVRVSLFKISEARLVLCMHKVEIEIINSAKLKLTFEKRPNIVVCFEIFIGKLVCQDKTFPRIARREAGFCCFFAFPAQITVRSVKIVKPRLDKFVHHKASLLNVNLSVLHWKPHKTESEFFVYAFHLVHPLLINCLSLLFCSDSLCCAEVPILF